MPSVSGLAHWWFGDITCFGIPFLCAFGLGGGAFRGSPSLNLFHHA